MSEDETTGTQDERKRKIGAAVLAVWDLFNELPTWKAVLPVLLAGYMGVNTYNNAQDKKRQDWIARAEARHSDITNRLDRIERQGEQPKPAGGIQ